MTEKREKLITQVHEQQSHAVEWDFLKKEKKDVASHYKVLKFSSHCTLVCKFSEIYV